MFVSIEHLSHVIQRSQMTVGFRKNEGRSIHIKFLYMFLSVNNKKKMFIYVGNTSDLSNAFEVCLISS